jgi:hypothetical protein
VQFCKDRWQTASCLYLIVSSLRGMDTFCIACNRFLQFSTMGFGLLLLQNGIWYLDEASKHRVTVGRLGELLWWLTERDCVEKIVGRQIQCNWWGFKEGFAEVAAQVPASEVEGKGEYFRFSVWDSLALEASFVQVCASYLLWTSSLPCTLDCSICVICLPVMGMLL